jgi:ABC-type transport system involved in multi-copper enzyme maturation permease subunit
MSPLADSGRAWLQRNVRWSNDRRAWQERAGFGIFLGGAAVSWLLADRLAPALQVFLWLALLLIVSVLLRRGWFSLAGPMFYHDLLRATRRSRFALYRLYSYFIVILVTLFGMTWYYHLSNQGMVPMRPGDNIHYAAAFFYTFTILQSLLVALIAPAYTAGALAEEKVRRTLEYLLATDLRNREIILSKLGTRLANLWLMILTGLPILSMVQWIGGVDPDLILIGFAATALTAAGLASLGVLTSVYARNPRSAIILAYLIAGGYVVVSYISSLFNGTWITTLTMQVGSIVITGADVLMVLQSGNPLVFLKETLLSVALGASFGDLVMNRFRHFAEFQISVVLVCCFWAIARVRIVFLKQADGNTARSREGWRHGFRPAVSRWPMIWKEFFVEGGFRLGIFGRILTILIVLSTFWPLTWILPGTTWALNAGLDPGTYQFSRACGSLIACLLLIVVALRASTSISSERDKQTLEALLTTPLGIGEILGAKWLASVCTVRWGWLWLAAIWGLGVFEGGMRAVSVVYMLLAWLVFASMLATLGLWFSAVCQTGLRASIYTLFSTAAVGVGFLILPFDALFPNAGFWLDWSGRVQEALSPPVVFGRLLPIPSDAMLAGPGLGIRNVYGLTKENWELPSAFAGLLFWAGVTAVLWTCLYLRFRRDCCRKFSRRAKPVLVASTLAVQVVSPLRSEDCASRLTG